MLTLLLRKPVEMAEIEADLEVVIEEEVASVAEEAEEVVREAVDREMRDLLQERGMPTLVIRTNAWNCKEIGL